MLLAFYQVVYATLGFTPFGSGVGKRFTDHFNISPFIYANILSTLAFYFTVFFCECIYSDDSVFVTP